MAISKGTVIFATSDCREGFDDARAWLTKQGYTTKDARMYRHDGMILVEKT